MESDILLAPTLRVAWPKSLSLSSLVGEFPKPPAECWRTSVRTPQDCGGYASLEKQNGEKIPFLFTHSSLIS